ncbi:hypothetical protein GCM10010287_14580 [Streptomyces variabilis]|uniref:Uncharacterized protein n=1 Tax=Streptomyces variabilis TaxID=67372 RepID=A0ABQ2TWQ2_9ACTN|nr:hypothetical protein [Streptomyces variabilis]GGP46879.1 hypothetical protein GCM10010265_25780 [Streptomyces griseoincarnatus]GGT42649.1 hypothetical protein GCM10010287_14580 [Streptomyces variabilis]
MRATAQPRLVRQLGDDPDHRVAVVRQLGDYPDHRVAHLGLPLGTFLAGGSAVLGDARRLMRRPRGRQLGVTVMTQWPFDSGREVGRGGITWKGPGRVKA